MWELPPPRPDTGHLVLRLALFSQLKEGETVKEPPSELEP